MNKYYHNIDTLKCIAVLGVFLYHLNPSLLPGGYSGVDVFFVISGFLIASSLKINAKIKKQDVLCFLKRRFLRVYPLYVFSIVIFSLASSFIYLPSDLVKQLNQVFPALLLFPNFHFLNHIDNGYFSTEAREAVFLHLWSVGVEFQNYIICGLFAWVISSPIIKYKKITVVTIIIVSLIYSQLLAMNNGTESFYLPLSRTWEFCVGILCYLIIKKNKKTLVSMIGLILIISFYACVGSKINYPGVWAIPVVVGTAIFILFSADSKNSTQNPLLVRYTGKISYSIYIWHWPIIAFINYLYGDVSVKAAFIAFLVTYAVSIFSYRYIETPFRGTKSINPVFKYGGVLAFVILSSLITVSVLEHDGYVNINKELYYKNRDSIDSFTQPAYKFNFNCQSSMASFSPTLFDNDRCITGKKDAPQMLIVGDSNAAHFVGYLSQIAVSEKLTFRNVTQSSCPPFESDVIAQYVDARYVNACKKYNKVLRAHINQYDVIFIGALWDKYYDNKSFKKHFEKMIADFSSDNKQIIIALKIPKFVGYDKLCFLKKMKVPFLDCAQRLSEGNVDIPVNRYITDMARENKNIHTFDMSSMLCDEKKCHSIINNIPVYFDSDHLSMNGSAYLGKIAMDRHAVPDFLEPTFFEGKRRAPLPIHEPDSSALWSQFK